MRVFDVCVVGAGPAGAALSIRLARDGYSVLLLEREQFPRDKVCGDLVSAKGLKMLADLGVYREVARRGFLPLRTAQAYLDGRFLAEAPLPSLPDHPPAGHAVPRMELDEILFRAALAAGASVLENCKVAGYELGRSLVTISAEIDGKRQRFSSRVIVGADGASSIVARQAGLEMRDPRHVQLAMRAYCRGLPLRHAVVFFAEDFFPGYGWIFPISDSMANIGVGMVKDSAQRDRLQLKRFYGRLLELVNAIARAGNHAVEISRPAGWPIKTYGGAARNHFDRGLLIGDAGCFVDPISGEGIPLALESAALAAETIHDAFAAGRFGPATMAAFERRWRRRFDPDLKLADLIVTAIRNRRLVKLWMQCLRVIALTAARDRNYAQKVGGILAGLVPCSAGLSADVVLGSIMHGPAFWLDTVSWASPRLPGTADEAAGLSREPAAASRDSAADARWLSAWAAELAAKQLGVAQLLAVRRSSPQS